MMDERPAPLWLIAVVRVVQGNDDAIAAAALLCAASLLAMMAIRVLVAWQTGLL